MRHRETAGDHLTARHIDNAAVAGARLAPGTRRVGPPGDSDEARPAVLHRDAVEMTTVLRPQRADKARLPDRAKARPLINGGAPAQPPVDKHLPAGTHH